MLAPVYCELVILLSSKQETNGYIRYVLLKPDGKALPISLVSQIPQRE